VSDEAILVTGGCGFLGSHLSPSTCTAQTKRRRLLDAKQLRHPICSITAGDQPRPDEVAEIVRCCVPGAQSEIGAEPDPEGTIDSEYE
jgi:nucleoside-diphosphate-sugar epimerase